MTPGILLLALGALSAPAFAASRQEPALIGIDTSGKRTLINIHCQGTDCDFVRKLYGDMRTDFKAALDGVYQGRSICNREDSLFGTGGEKETNHLGKSCGQGVCEFKTDAKAPSGSDPSLSGSCEKERAWKRGALVERARAKLEEAIAELRDKNRLEVRATCSSAFRDDAGRNLANAVNSLNAEWKQAMKGQPIRCDIDPKAPGGSGSSEYFYLNDRRIPVQAGCHLSSALGGIYAAIAQAGVCEAFARAEEDWAGSLESSVDGIPDGLAAEALAECKKRNPKPAGKALASCANRSYSEKIEEEFARPSVPKAGTEARGEPAVRSGALRPEASEDLFAEPREEFQRRAWKSLETARIGLKKAAEYVSKTTVYDVLREAPAQPTGPGAKTLTFPGPKPGRSPAPRLP